MAGVLRDAGHRRVVACILPMHDTRLAPDNVGPRATPIVADDTQQLVHGFCGEGLEVVWIVS